MLSKSPDQSPVTTTAGLERRLSLRHFGPLAGFVLPSALIGYGFVIPRSCIAGLNELSLGYAMTLIGACVTYWAGLRSAVRTGGDHGQG
jgi:hypothetical protein